MLLSWSPPVLLSGSVDVREALNLTQSAQKQMRNKTPVPKGYFSGSRLTTRNLDVADKASKKHSGLCAKHKHYFVAI